MLVFLLSAALTATMVQAGAASHYGPVAEPPKQVVGEPARQVVAVSPSIQCRTEYVTLWDTTYQEREEQVCTTVYEKECQTKYQQLCQPTTRQECHTKYEEQCHTEYRQVCVEKYTTEYEPYTESECTTQYKEDCQFQWEGQGNDKVWAPIPGTCEQVPYDECNDVTKTHARQVAHQVCNDVPETKCVSVPKEVCVTVPDQVCTNEPLTECQDIPRQNCHDEHRRFPIRVSRQEAKKVCDEGHPAPVAPFAVPHAPIPAPVVPAPHPAAVPAVPAPHHAPSVSDLLDYARPAVPVQTLPQIIAAKQVDKSSGDRIVFSS